MSQGSGSRSPSPSASFASASGEDAPVWFRHFEERFENIMKATRSEIKDIKDGLEFHIGATESKFQEVDSEVKKLWEKIDDLENRARRNNLVLYNIPEGTEQNADCIQFLNTFSREFLGVQPPEFQRAHRTPTGPVRDPGSKPRPIHILMPTFQAKLSFRKAAIDVIKGKQFKGNKLYISDDLSHRVQQQRKELLPVLKGLKDSGKKAYFTYPATIRYWDGGHLKVYNSNKDKKQ